MAGPGGGPPRKSHTKSRKGCETCKKRHLKCDENSPQCRNCTKHNVRCPYMDMPPQDDRAPTPERPDLLWTPAIEAEIETWRQTGKFPFPGLFIFPEPNPQLYSIEDLRLIHHVASISAELNARDAANYTIWTGRIPLFLNIANVYPFVMHALLAFSATHIAWTTDCPLVHNMAYEHRGIAFQGLQEAIGMFSPKNSDAVLAASLLLSWQASDWRGWTHLMTGTSAVIDAMDPWKHESNFGDFIAEQSTFPTAPASPLPDARRLSQPRRQDLEALQNVYAQLQQVEGVLSGYKEDTTAIAQLMSFVRSIRKVSPSQTAAQRFEMLNPLRAWLFFLPVRYLQEAGDNPYALVVLAYYYTVALVVEPIFPEIGAAYFGSLSLKPIEAIARCLFSVSHGLGDALQNPLSLMAYPIDMVARFRDRMGWTQPHRTASFPVFQQQTTMEMPIVHTNSPYPCSNPAFTYSQEHLAPFASEPGSAASPLTLDMFGSHQYLGIPSPSPYGGYQSPGSSYGEVAYSDNGADDFLFDNQTSGFGGFVGPHTVWI